MGSAPLFLRKFVLDFVETALGMFLGLNLVFPTDFTQAQQITVIVASATFAAFVSAARRAVPAFLIWLAGKLNLPTDNQQ